MPAKPRKVSDSGAAVYTVSHPRAFADSNVPLYLLSETPRKAAAAQAILRAHCFISAQVLNEITNVMRQKYRYTWAQVAFFLKTLRAQCPVESLTLETHDLGRRIAERYQLQFFDALIAASALLAKCGTLYSEDMQHGLLLEGRLRIVNPFFEPAT
ncbi:MAG: PIN domain-containing protein [Azoarcus sp.]|jgi:predicted nucleic acid-binding protein|nr:PIN domain-containing protein [Azoarcus sp.]